MPTPAHLDLPRVRIPHVDGIDVVRPLGRGGMGAVLAGRDTRTGQRIAIKVIGGVVDELARARFAAEIDALAHVRDAHVVGLRSSGEVDGIPYAVLDRVGGFTLDRIRRALPWPIVVGLGRQLARAIAAVHAAGYLHRDIKPSNIILGRRGNLTLIDFGIAKRWHAPDAPACDATDADPALTVPGLCVGTPRFLAPEVARGGDATPRSDLYGFGLVMVALLGASPAADTPVALRDVIARCLEKDPEQRPSSAAEIAAILDRLPSRRARLCRSVFDDVAVIELPAVGSEGITRALITGATNPRALAAASTAASKKPA